MRRTEIVATNNMTSISALTRCVKIQPALDALRTFHASGEGTDARHVVGGNDLGPAHLPSSDCVEFSTHSRPCHTGKLRRGANDLGGGAGARRIESRNLHRPGSH